ncbi:hypothetical protein INR49_012059, partial [Caranx melampygus]
MTKSSTVDLVTKTDERVEKIIIGSLKEEFGEGTHCFIGEESVAKGEPCILTDKPTWIIDPVDGTTNFVHGFPFVAVSIAFAVNKELEFGVVYSCLEDKMYKARKGKGAFCDDEPIQVSDVKEIKKSIIISEHGTDRSPEKVTKIFSTMQKILCIPVHGLRGSGTAATNMCLVASGAVEAFFEIGIHCWDIAAGAVIVKEAGGILLDVNGPIGFCHNLGHTPNLEQSTESQKTKSMQFTKRQILTFEKQEWLLMRRDGPKKSRQKKKRKWAREKEMVESEDEERIQQIHK